MCECRKAWHQGLAAPEAISPPRTTSHRLALYHSDFTIMDEIVLSDKQIAALAAFAASEGDYAAAASEPISPPADVTTDKELLHWFFNSYLPEHHQRFRVVSTIGP